MKPDLNLSKPSESKTWKLSVSRSNKPREVAYSNLPIRASRLPMSRIVKRLLYSYSTFTSFSGL